MVGRRRDTDNNEVVMEEGGMLEDSLMEEEEEEGRDSFLQPSSKTRFTLRKRKRRGAAGKEAADQPDGDNVSVCSLEMDQEQPESKKKKPHLSRMGSLSNMLSLKKVGKMGSALQKSISSARLGSPVTSLRTPSRASLARSASTVFGDPGGGPPPPGGRRSPGSMSLQDGPAGWAGSPFRRSSVNLGLARKSSTSNLTPYKVPGPTPSKSRPTRYWSEVYSAVVHKLSKQEVKLQEAVFEIFNGEDDLVEDLKLVRKTYADSLIHLNILSPAEEQLVFGHMSALAPLHQQFHTNLKRAQCKDGFWFEIGPAVDKWIRTIESPYVNYCSNLIQVGVAGLVSQSTLTNLLPCRPRHSSTGNKQMTSRSLTFCSVASSLPFPESSTSGPSSMFLAPDWSSILSFSNKLSSFLKIPTISRLSPTRY